MSNRPGGGDRSKRWDRAPYDWYRESPAVVEQLLDAIDFGDDLIWDPCCGAGNVLDVAKRWGHLTIGSDIVDRQPRHRFFRANVVTQVRVAPQLTGYQTSVICNPPYGYERDIAERIIRRVLELPVRRAAFIVPIAFMAGQERRRLFMADFRPSHACIYSERHTMPPGHLIDQMAKPYDGGMADYCAIVFTRPHRWRTETVWLAPGNHIPRNLRRIDQGATA